MMLGELDTEGLDEIDVDMFWHGEAVAPQIIGTVGLNGCIGIAVMNDSDGWAWVLHSPNLTNVDDQFRGLIAWIAAKYPAGEGLRIVLLGGDDSYPIERKSVRAARDLVETTVTARLPAADLHTDWGLLGRGFQLEHDGEAWRDLDGHPSFAT